jgi:hypothetical protein
MTKLAVVVVNGCSEHLLIFGSLDRQILHNRVPRR